MPTIELDDAEWSQVMGVLSTAPWRDVNPLLMKIGVQLQAQQRSKQQTNNQDAAPGDPASRAN
jgi:hypothetical protein